MNIVALVLALVAIVCFLIEYYDRRRSLVPLGLALLTAAWIVQLVWVTPHTVTIH